MKIKKYKNIKTGKEYLREIYTTHILGEKDHKLMTSASILRNQKKKTN